MKGTKTWLTILLAVLLVNPVTAHAAGGKIQPIEKIEPIERMEEDSGPDDPFSIELPQLPRPERPEISRPTPIPVPTLPPFVMPTPEPTVSPVTAPTPSPTEGAGSAPAETPAPMPGVVNGADHGETPSAPPDPPQDDAEAGQTGPASQPETELPDNIGMIAGIVVVVLAMGALMFYLNKKKQEAPAEESDQTPKSFGDTFRGRMEEHQPPAEQNLNPGEAEAPELPHSGIQETARSPKFDNQRPPDLF